MTERDPGESFDEGQLQVPLLPGLAEFLRGRDIACLMQATNQGTAFVIKLPGREITSVRGRVPIYVRHELYSHPSAPVIRTVLTVYDQPDRPLALETFTNVEQPDQREDFAHLAEQEQLLLLFYDEQLAHRLSKVVPYQDQGTIQAILSRAERELAGIPPDRFSFEQAKEAVIKRTRL